MVCGLVDLGANSIRLTIFKLDNGRPKSLINKKETAGLSSYVRDGALTQPGMEKACEVLKGFLNILENFDIEKLYVFATASLRNISNTEQAVLYIRQKTGIAVDVLSGEEEARLDFVGARCANNIRDGILIDIGGGSTEIAELADGSVISAASMPVGSLNLYVRHVEDIFPTDKTSRKIYLDVQSELSKLSFYGPEKYPFIYGIGGTIRATAKLANEILSLPSNNREISYEHLSEILDTFKKSKQLVLRKILQTAPERVHTLIPGMILLRTVAKRFDSQVILANNFGVREGYLYDRVLGGTIHACGVQR